MRTARLPPPLAASPRTSAIAEIPGQRDHKSPEILWKTQEWPSIMVQESLRGPFWGSTILISISSTKPLWPTAPGGFQLTHIWFRTSSWYGIGPDGQDAWKKGWHHARRLEHVASLIFRDTSNRSNYLSHDLPQYRSTAIHQRFFWQMVDSDWHLSSAKDMRRIWDTRLVQVAPRFARLGGLRCHSSKRCCLPNHLTTVAAERSTFASWAHLGASEFQHVSAKALWSQQNKSDPFSQ